MDLLEIKRVLSPITNRIQLMISKCKLNIVDDTSNTQTGQIEAFHNEIHNDAQVWQQFGITSVPPSGSEAIALFLGGERKNPIVISTENKALRVRNLKSGEVCLYSSGKSKITLKEDDSIEIYSETISIKNKENELIELLEKLCDALLNATTNTMLGPQPLLNSIDITEIKNKISSFKGKK